MTTDAERIVVHAMTDDELRNESKRLQDRASADQSMAHQMRREIKRRRNSLRRAVTKANEGV
jgi:hypothetical protein